MADYNFGVPIEITDIFTVGGIPMDPTLVTWTFVGPDGVTFAYTNADP